MADYEAPIVNGRPVLSTAAAAMLTESGAMASRAFLLGANNSRVELPVISGGSVQLDSGSMIRRTASFSMLGAWSDSPFTRLSPYGARVAIQRGIRIAPSTTEWVQLMEGPITETDQDSENNSAEMQMTVKDDFWSVGRNRFDVITSTDPTKTVVENITEYARRGRPDAPVIDLTGSTRMAGKMDVQRDPVDGIDKLAASIGAECFAGRDGSVVIRPQPTLDDPPVWTLSVGDQGNLIAVSRKRTAERTYNRVLATGRTDDTSAQGSATPVPWGEAVISDITDPLLYGGPFGKVTRFFTSPLLKDDAQAALAAAALLEKARGRNIEFSFTSLVNPAAEPGDVFLSQLSDGRTRVHIIESLTVPLTATDSQPVETRGQELPDESEQSSESAA